MSESLTENDFPPIPSVDGAFRAPDGRIVYTAERDAILAHGERRSGYRLLLERLGLRSRGRHAARHPTRDLKDGV